MDRGFLYGDGFFETILAVDGKPEYLSEHLERLDRSCRKFHIQYSPDSVDWHKVLDSLLRANGHGVGLSVVKIIVTRGTTKPGLNLTGDGTPTVIVMVRPYSRETGTQWDTGVHLTTFPLRRSSPVAHYKSLNYLYYLTARQYAIDQGADEAILLNPDGKVLECAAANIFFRTGDTVIKPPKDAPYLKGIMEKEVLSILRSRGFSLLESYFEVEDMLCASEVFITNSVIRVVPVAEIEGKSCTSDHTIVELLRKKIGFRHF